MILNLEILVAKIQKFLQKLALIHFYLYICPMKDKVDHYTICFIDNCPLHKHCLRWMVGRYADPSRTVYLSINPHNPLVANDDCPQYREDIRVKMKKGFVNIYYDMPGHMEAKIRQQLIAKLGRKPYFEMRKGQRLITPEQQELIERVIRANGWEGPIRFDGEEEDYLW